MTHPQSTNPHDAGGGLTSSQRERLLDLRHRLQPLGGKIVEIRECAGFLGITVRGGGLRRDDGAAELLMLPDGSAHIGVVAVPTGRPVSWETIERQPGPEDQ
jgi:hypothetical protein